MNEYIIFIGVAFWLVYFAQTFENDWLKMFLKLFSILIILLTSFIPFVEIGEADQFQVYELFAFAMINGIIFFMVIWFVIFLYELFLFLADRKKARLEGTQ